MKFQFESLAAFVHMDGHGIFVWSAYAIVYTILIYLTLNPLLQKRAFLKQQRKWQAIQKNADSIDRPL